MHVDQKRANPEIYIEIYDSLEKKGLIPYTTDDKLDFLNKAADLLGYNKNESWGSLGSVIVTVKAKELLIKHYMRLL